MVGVCFFGGSGWVGVQNGQELQSFGGNFLLTFLVVCSWRCCFLLEAKDVKTAPKAFVWEALKL